MLPFEDYPGVLQPILTDWGMHFLKLKQGRISKKKWLQNRS